MDILFFKAALAAYFLSTVGYVISLLVKRVLVAKVSMWVLFSAFFVQSLSFGARCIATGQSPILGIHDALSLIAWIMTGAYLAFQLKTKTRNPDFFDAAFCKFAYSFCKIRLRLLFSIPPALQG